MRILFQGDSVTDAGRNYSDPNDLGPGYVSVCAKRLQEALPKTSFTFLNRGISGNRTSQVLDRWQAECLDLHPDLVTLLIGVNDSWHRCPPTNIDTTDEQFEQNYRGLLQALHDAKIPVVLMEPFTLPSSFTPEFRKDLLSKIEIVRCLAREYSASGDVLAYLPLDGLTAAESMKNGVASITDDGVHPNASGRIWLGNLLADALLPLLQ